MSESPFSILDEIVVKKDPNEVLPDEPPSGTEPPKEEKKVEPDKKPAAVEPEKAKETKIEPPKSDNLEVKVETKKPNAREQFQRLEDAKSDAEKTRDVFKGQVELHEKTIEQLTAQVKELEPLQGTEKELKTALKQTQDELAAAREELKAASITRDPEFVERYEKGKEFQVGTLKEIALSRDVSESDFLRAIRIKDEERLTEIRDSLPPQQQRKWDAVMLKIEQIDLERDEAVQNSNKTWERIQSQRQQQVNQGMEKRMQEHRSIGKQTAEAILSQVDILKDDAPLRTEMLARAEAIAGGEGSEHYTADKIIKEIVAVPALRRLVHKQAEGLKSLGDENQAKDATIKELTEKVESLETFVKKRHGALPGSDTPQKNGSDEIDKEKPIWEQVVVRV